MYYETLTVEFPSRYETIEIEWADDNESQDRLDGILEDLWDLTREGYTLYADRCGNLYNLVYDLTALVLTAELLPAHL